MLKQLLITLFTTLHLTTLSATWVDTLKDNLTALTKNVDGKQIAKDALETYFKDWVSLIAHESGHAVVSKILYGGQPEIILGSGSLNKFFNLNLGPFIIAGITPYIGRTFYNKTYESSSNSEAQIISAAGPIAQALAYYLFTVCTNCHQHPNWTSQEKLLYSLLDFDQYACLISNLIPDFPNDGSYIFPQIQINLKYIILIKVLAMTALAIAIGKLRAKYTKDTPRYWAKLITATITRFSLVGAHLLLNKVVSPC